MRSYPGLRGLSIGRPVPGSSVAVSGDSSRSVGLAKVALLIGVALALLVIVLAFAPAWLLPRPLLVPVAGHQEDLVFTGIAMTVGIGIGIGIVYLLP